MEGYLTWLVQGVSIAALVTLAGWVTSVKDRIEILERISVSIFGRIKEELDGDEERINNVEVHIDNIAEVVAKNTYDIEEIKKQIEETESKIIRHVQPLA